MFCIRNKACSIVPLQNISSRTLTLHSLLLIQIHSEPDTMELRRSAVRSKNSSVMPGRVLLRSPVSLFYRKHCTIELVNIIVETVEDAAIG